MTWAEQFRDRMQDFGSPFPRGGHTISIKVRVDSGCFHREHSPHAYRIIDDHLESYGAEHIRFEEHESGPELLVWLAIGTSAITLAKSVIELITAIIKARSEGIAKGDRPSDPIVLIVRDVGPDGQVREVQVLRLSPHDPVSSKVVEDALNTAAAKLLPSPSPEPKATASGKATKPKKKTQKRSH